MSIFNSSTGRCWASEVYCPVPGTLENVPSSNNYDVSVFVIIIAFLCYSCLTNLNETYLSIVRIKHNSEDGLLLVSAQVRGRDTRDVKKKTELCRWFPSCHS